MRLENKACLITAAGSRADSVARQPIDRIGKAEEVAALCVYLASDESGDTTGATHMIDRGWTI